MRVTEHRYAVKTGDWNNGVAVYMLGMKDIREMGRSEDLGV